MLGAKKNPETINTQKTQKETCVTHNRKKHITVKQHPKHQKLYLNEKKGEHGKLDEETVEKRSEKNCMVR